MSIMSSATGSWSQSTEKRWLSPSILPVSGVKEEFALEVHFRGQVIGVFRADLVVNGCVIVELKALKELGSSHEAQTLNYLRAGVLEVGLLLNFGPEPQIRRLAFSNDRKARTAGAQHRHALPAPGSQLSPICVHLR